MPHTGSTRTKNMPYFEYSDLLNWCGLAVVLCYASVIPQYTGMKVLANTSNRLDDAARAGWFYYVAQNNQEEIAKKMSVSRQTAQRLIAQALREGLIKFRLDHPIAKCLDLAESVKAKFGLDYCEVTPTDPYSDDPALGIAQVAAELMEKFLAQKAPLVFAIGTGKEIRGAVDCMSTIHCPQHRIVSLVGSLAPDGSANFNDAITRLGDLTLAPRHPLAVPVIATSKQERQVVCAQKPIARNIDLGLSADVSFVGIGELNDSPPLLMDGFINQKELSALQKAGAVGEIIGWAFDQQGKKITGLTNDRVSSVPLKRPPAKPVFGVARGQDKLPAIKGALLGRWVTGLITDEVTAEALLT
jgi:DNA-binding transcriptional regulator LsrR (DeoR family)